MFIVAEKTPEEENWQRDCNELRALDKTDWFFDENFRPMTFDAMTKFFGFHFFLRSVLNA